MFACEEHILMGIHDLDLAPHIKKTNKSIKCKYCKRKSKYELYYFDYDYLHKPLKFKKAPF
ncbi:hypothetical protein COM99_26010 [Bacillus cereus]|nr:hypothetical protein COM99_26010 [Bacillus cereus]TXR64445.1 hypothetical protein DM800_14625 [Bacillus sp. AY18-3]